jgi:hypothetical protein
MKHPAAILWACCLLSVHGEFAIHDGDTVVFLGDSITAVEHSIIDFQREMVRPISVRFEVRKIGD